jgi:hypothetical protein
MRGRAGEGNGPILTSLKSDGPGGEPPRMAGTPDSGRPPEADESFRRPGPRVITGAGLRHDASGFGSGQDATPPNTDDARDVNDAWDASAQLRPTTVFSPAGSPGDIRRSAPVNPPGQDKTLNLACQGRLTLPSRRSDLPTVTSGGERRRPDQTSRQPSGAGGRGKASAVCHGQK